MISKNGMEDQIAHPDQAEALRAGWSSYLWTHGKNAVQAIYDSSLVSLGVNLFQWAGMRLIKASADEKPGTISENLLKVAGAGTGLVCTYYLGPELFLRTVAINLAASKLTEYGSSVAPRLLAPTCGILETIYTGQPQPLIQACSAELGSMATTRLGQSLIEKKDPRDQQYAQLLFSNAGRYAGAYLAHASDFGDLINSSSDLHITAVTPTPTPTATPTPTSSPLTSKQSLTATDYTLPIVLGVSGAVGFMLLIAARRCLSSDDKIQAMVAKPGQARPAETQPAETSTSSPTTPAITDTNAAITNDPRSPRPLSEMLLPGQLPPSPRPRPG